MTFQEAVEKKRCLYMSGEPSEGCCGKKRAKNNRNYCAEHKKKCAGKAWFGKFKKN